MRFLMLPRFVVLFLLLDSFPVFFCRVSISSKTSNNLLDFESDPQDNNETFSYRNKSYHSKLLKKKATVVPYYMKRGFSDDEGKIVHQRNTDDDYEHLDNEDMVLSYPGTKESKIADRRSGGKYYYDPRVVDLLTTSSQNGLERKEDNNHGWGCHHQPESFNAIGLLGLLGLFNFLATIALLLRTTTTTAAAAGGRRKRRSKEAGFSVEDKQEELFEQLLPLLIPVAHARNGVIPWECTLSGICNVNKVLAEEFGLQGRVLGSRVTNAISQVLEPVSSFNHTIAEFAGGRGRTNRDCSKLGAQCIVKPKSEEGALHNIPFILKMKDISHLYKTIKNMEQGSSELL